MFKHLISTSLESDVLYFKQLNTPVVVLNTVRAADELLSKRGANYCDRPRFVLFEVMSELSAAPAVPATLMALATIDDASESYATPAVAATL